MLWFFTDEEKFYQKIKVNQRNDKWFGRDPKGISMVIHTKFPATVTVLGVVSNETYIIPPFLRA